MNTLSASKTLRNNENTLQNSFKRINESYDKTNLKNINKYYVHFYWPGHIIINQICN